MDIERLEIADVWLCTPRQHADDRGVFLEWFRADLLADQTKRRFDIAQANHSISRRGTVRGLHYADVPPGQAKYVYCSRGAVLDVVVDIRVGSATFGQHIAARLDDEQRQGLFIAEGLAHGFCALTETAEVTYIVSTTYNPAAEHAISPLDTELGIPWPDGGSLILSDTDRAAPSLDEQRASGLLPSYDACRARYAELNLS